jgi:hypothetical protein
MSKEAIPFDSVSFWDMAGERHLPISGQRTIQEISMVPLPGDRVSFDRDEEQFVVAYREFKFHGGICHVRVNVQPATRRA